MNENEIDISHYIQEIDPTPYIAASWIVSGLLLGAMALWVWYDWQKARKNI